jgi:serine/threonine protein kinase
MKFLFKLKKWLTQNNYHKIAQEIKDLEEYAESWHQEAVEEFGPESISEDEYLEQVVHPDLHDEDVSMDIISKIFVKEGFKPVSAGGKSSYIGRGSFGRVYRGIYKGQPVVAKIVLVEDFVEKFINDFGFEAPKWHKLMSIKDKISPNLRKHIPQVFLSKVDSISPTNDGVDKHYQYEIIVMEELKPLNKHLGEIIGNYKSEESFNLALKDEDFLYDLAKMISRDLDSWFYFEDLTPEEIFKVLYSMRDINSYSHNDIINNIANYVVNEYDMSSELIKVKRVLNTSLIKVFVVKEGFPGQKNYNDPNSTEYNPLFGNLPETKQLLSFLEEMSSLGISWADVKENNLMMGNDGNIKIIDMGLYKIE